MATSLPEGPTDEIIGMTAERSRLQATLDSARHRQAAVLAVEGVPGAGKTALLDHAASTAADFTVMRCNGIEGERDLPFGSLTSLLRDQVDAIRELDPAHAEALLGAIALGPPTPADRLAVGMALLQLMATLAEAQPLLVLVDDLQWIDDASRQAMLFALHRVRDDCVAAMLGVRSGAPIDRPNVKTLVLSGLTEHESITLVTRDWTWNDTVAAEIARRCDGNPLSLVEVSAALTDRQRLGLDPISDLLPAGPATVHLFSGPISTLTEPTRFGLLLAALCHDPTPVVVESAATGAGHTAPDWSEAERARLIARGPSGIRFTHPLARHAVVDLAEHDDVRRAHLALADVVADEQRRTWHCADAAIAPDNDLAAKLEFLAFTAMTQGDTHLAMRSVVRAAELSAEPEAAAGRYLLGAQCAVMSSAPPAELTRLAGKLGSPDVRAQALVIEAAASAWSGDSAGLRRLMDANMAELEAHDRSLAAIVCAFGSFAAFNRLDLSEGLALSERAWTLADERLDLPHPFGLIPAICIAIHGFRGGFDRTDELLAARAAVEAAEAVDLVTPLAVGFIFAGRLVEGLAFAERMLTVARQRNQIMAVGWIATACAMTAALLGDLRAAQRWGVQGRDLGMSCGNDYITAQACAVLASVAAQRGDADSVARYREQFDGITGLEIPQPTTLTLEFAEIVIELRTGATTAIDQLRSFPRTATAMSVYWPVDIELIEALVADGRLEEAWALAPVLDAMLEHEAAGHLGPVERCRGLLAPSTDFDGHFTASIEALTNGSHRLELARTQLAYGTRLIDASRRTEAIDQLSAALLTFLDEGCAPWVDRTTAALRMAGEMPPVRDAHSTESLTSQEEQVAHAVASGMTNREAAAAMFVSTKTIESHLTRVYRKLGVRSRTELANLLRG